MRIIDVLSSPWAILPDKLAEIQAIYATHLRGEKIDIKSIEAKLGRPLDNSEQGYEIINGVAVIPVEGVISKRMNLFSQISGGVSSQLIARDIQGALDNPDVGAIILRVDSPGGTVDGTQELARQVRAAGQQKPVVTFVDGMMASAAYWIGSAASASYIGSGTDVVGSVGVVASHTDISKREEAMGIKVTEIYAGKYKRIASEHKTLSEAGQQYMQDNVDYLYTVFVADVAMQRGVDVETVLKNMADGRVFTGQQAIDAGLVDGASTLSALIADLAAGGPLTRQSARPATRLGAGAASIPQPIIEDQKMDLSIDDVKTKHPAIAEALRAEGAAKAAETARAEGATSERARIEAVLAQSMPGHDAMIKALAFDGVTTGPEAAVKVLAAERSQRSNALDALKADGQKLATIPAVHTPAVETVGTEDASLPLEDRCKARWDKDKAVRAEFGSLDRYLAYEKAAAAGKVRLLRK